MIKQIRYAVRRLSDGFYFEQPLGRGGRGGSHLEPIDPKTPAARVRLFSSKVAANNALIQWCKGVHVKHTSPGYYSMGLEAEIEPEEWSIIEPVEGRKKVDFEIVAVEIRIYE